MVDFLSSAIISVGVAFVLGLLGISAILLVSYLLMKDGARTICTAIEKFFCPGCNVSTRGSIVTVRQVAPLLELATVQGDFEHKFTWTSNNRKVFGVPIPFSARTAECRHVYRAKAGFDLREQECRIELTRSPVGPPILRALLPWEVKHVRISLPNPRILSVETLDASISDGSGIMTFWNRLGEKERNAIMTDMFVRATEHLQSEGKALIEEAKRKLADGLRGIMPLSAGEVEIKWMETQDIALTEGRMLCLK